MTAERIRDKVAASRKKGMWMGGVPPFGYAVENRKLVVDEESAAHVRWIFARFLEIGSGTELAREVGARGIRTPRGNRIDKKYLYRMLNNRAYIGEAVHKGDSYPGEHDAIIDRETWDRVHAILQESPRKRAARTRADTPALLKGLLFGPDGAAFSPTHTRKGGQALPLLRQPDGAEAWRRVVPGRPRARGRDRGRRHRPAPRRVPPARDRGGTWKAARAQDDDITEADARAALQQLDPLWDELFPAEQARIVALLVERVDIGTDGLNVRLRVDGLGGLAREMLAGDIGARGMTRATPIPETVTLHVPFRIVKRGGRKEMQLPEGAAPAAQARQHAGQGAGARVPLEADAGVGRVRHHRRTGRARGDRAVLHDPRPAADAARARHRRGDPGREAGAGGDAGAGAGAVSGGVGEQSEHFNDLGQSGRS